MAITPVNSRAELARNDYVAPSEEWTGPFPTSQVSAGGRTIVFSYDPGHSWDGVLTYGLASAPTRFTLGVPIMINSVNKIEVYFPVPIIGCGTYMNLVNASGSISIDVEFYNAEFNSIGTHQVVTNTDIDDNGTVTYAGGRSDATDISAVQFRGAFGPSTYDLQFDDFDMVFPGGGDGDPYFAGFDGQNYEVSGEHGKVLNILSDSNIQVNALFNNCIHPDFDGLTYMHAFGIKVGNKSVGVHKIFYSIDKPPRFDHELIGENKIFPTGIYDAKGQMVMGSVGKIGNKLIINTGEYILELGRMSECNQDMLSIKASVTSLGVLADGVLPHGILGVTGRFDKRYTNGGNQGEGILDGNWKDYIVSSLYADDFKYNCFEKASGKILFGKVPGSGRALSI